MPFTPVIDTSRDPMDYAALMGDGGNADMIGRDTVLPREFWPSEEQYNRTTQMMQDRGIDAPPRGTLRNSSTQQLGQALARESEEESNSSFGFGSPGFAALVIMGSAVAGGALRGASAGGSGTATVSASNTAAGSVAAPTTAAGLPTGAAAASGGGMGAMTGGIPAVGATTSAVPAAAAASRGIGSFLRNNRDIIGSVVGGIGESMAADRMAENNLDVLRERENLTRQNYTGTDPSRTFRGLNPGTSTLSPVERFDKYSGWSFQYNQKTGRIERVSDDQLAAQAQQ